MDLATWMSPEGLKRVIARVRCSGKPMRRLSLARESLSITLGWTNLLFVGVKGAWRRWFTLSGDVVRNDPPPGRHRRRYALISDARS